MPIVLRSDMPSFSEGPGQDRASVFHCTHPVNIPLPIGSLAFLFGSPPGSVNLPGLRDGQIAGKTLFMGVFVRVLSKEISIQIDRLSKEDHSLPMQGALLSLWRE